MRSGDWHRLTSFACATGAWYEDDVERFVQRRLRGHYESRKAHIDISVIVLATANDPDDILAIGAHELDDQVTDDGLYLEGSYLIVGAVRRDVQGQRTGCRAVRRRPAGDRGAATDGDSDRRPSRAAWGRARRRREGQRPGLATLRARRPAHGAGGRRR